MKPTRILMVCLGNICRSPMAEGIMQHKIDTYQLNATVESKGTAPYHIGDTPDHRGIQTLEQYDIDISRHRGQQFSVGDFDKFDFIYAMDESNLNNILALSRNKNDREKVKLILEESFPGQNKIVFDPYYGSMSDFEDTYTLLNSACEIIAQKLV